MDINGWSIIHIIGALLCLSWILVYQQKKGMPRQVYIAFCAILILHISGFLWHSFGAHFPADRVPNALLFLDIFSMLCLAGAGMFFYWSIDNLSHKVLKSDAAGDISELDMNAVESAKNCYVFQYGKLYILFPQYNEIKFVFQKCPSMKNKRLTFFSTATYCREFKLGYFLSAALFGKANPRYHQVSVVGCHAQDGVLYKGAEWEGEDICAFTFYDGQAHFVRENADDAVKLAAENGGDGFESITIIWDGKLLDTTIKKERCFRVLAELNGRICIMESSAAMIYEDFIQSLLDAGVQKAIYLDMGAKSSYSQYRNNQNRVINLFSRFGIYFSGWIAFYK